MCLYDDIECYRMLHIYNKHFMACTYMISASHRHCTIIVTLNPKKECAQNKNAKESETSERTRSNYDDAG